MIPIQVEDTTRFDEALRHFSVHRDDPCALTYLLIIATSESRKQDTKYVALLNRLQNRETE